MAISNVLNSYSNISYPAKPLLNSGSAGAVVSAAQPKSAIFDSSVQISDEAKHLFEQSQKTDAAHPDWAIDTTITTNTGEVIKTQWIDVNKMLDEKLSTDDKKVLGFPFSGKDMNGDTLRTLIAQAVVNGRDAGTLNGPISKNYLLGDNPYQLGLSAQVNFQDAKGQAVLQDILSRVTV